MVVTVSDRAQSVACSQYLSFAWASQRPSLSFNFLICKVGLSMPTLQDCAKGTLLSVSEAPSPLLQVGFMLGHPPHRSFSIFGSEGASALGVDHSSSQITARQVRGPGTGSGGYWGGRCGGASLLSGSYAHLMLDGAGTIVHVVAVNQHVCHFTVPQQCDVVPLFGLQWMRERPVCMWPLLSISHHTGLRPRTVKDSVPRGHWPHTKCSTFRGRGCSLKSPSGQMSLPHPWGVPSYSLGPEVQFLVD